MHGLWPDALDDADPTARQRRALEALRTLGLRALPGIFVYLALAVAYTAAVWDQPASRRVSIAVSAALLALGAARLGLHRFGTRMMQHRPERWRAVFGAFAIASILLWDGFASIELLQRDLDPTSVMLVIASSGLRASGTHSLAPDLRLLRIYATASRLPMLVTLLVIDTRVAHLLFFLISLQALYGLLLGRRLNAEFWQAFATRDSLERHTTELDDKSRGLEQANAALTAEIVARQRIEVELRLAQKLEAVGRLAAGIAHEINTPLQSVAGNLHFARDSVNDMLSLIATYRGEYEALAGSGATAAIRDRVTAAEQAADLPYLIENLPQALDSARDGVGRTATIVRSLREFAHPDEADMAPTDLNRAVETTLAISRHEYAAIAEVATELGDLPPVVCHAGEINEVLLHLLVNAAHAIEAAPRPRGAPGRITVRTRRIDDSVEIAVSDTGGGIPLEVRDRIFDPFFTTKEIGKGTGQGLAVARSVMLHHGGEIAFDSELGRGTTFVLRIPIQRRASAGHIAAGPPRAA